MLVSKADLPIVSWARSRGYSHYYCRESSLPEPCLKVHLGQVVACFHEGALVRLMLQVDGELINEVFCHLRELLDLCDDTGAYMAQQPPSRIPPRIPSCLSQN